MVELVVVSVVLLPEFDAAEPLVSVDELPAVLGVLDDAPMLDVPEVLPLVDAPAALGVVELFDVDGLVDEEVDGAALEFEPLEV